MAQGYILHILIPAEYFGGVLPPCIGDVMLRGGRCSTGRILQALNDSSEQDGVA